jgi:SAM-dependent methyltransferase
MWSSPASSSSSVLREPGVRRLNWGSGTSRAPGWINSDFRDDPGVDLPCDIRDGLPLESGSVDYAVSVHALQELPLDDVVPALRELRRVLRPGGALRLILPDLDRGIEAYRRGDRDYFIVPDENARSLGGKLITHVLWYGYSRTLFTRDFIEELLGRAGFAQVHQCGYRQTTTPFPGIVELDNRELESLFVEGVKAA